MSPPPTVERPDLAAAYEAIVRRYAARAEDWRAGSPATAAAYERCAAPLLARVEADRPRR